MHRLAKQSIANPAMTKPAKTLPGSTPPKNSMRLRMGRIVRKVIPTVANRDANRPITISLFFKGVMSSKSKVPPSFSSAMAPAVERGVSKKTARYCIPKNKENMDDPKDANSSRRTEGAEKKSSQLSP